MTQVERRLAAALWKIYRRPERPQPWQQGGNLPWNEPAFAERMLREHLDDSHGAASRATPERARQIEWLWSRLKLRPGVQLLDVTCGPGLYAVEFARRGCTVTGVDFSPAAIAYARDLARAENVAGRCRFVEQDVRQADFGERGFETAIFLYGQLAVFTRDEARDLLARLAHALKPGGKLCVELLDPARVDRKESTWWFTDNTGLWGDAPFLHLGERFWLEDEQMSVERFHLIHLETGELTEIQLCDQAYAAETMTRMMREAGFAAVHVLPAWDGLPFYDAPEWVVYIAEKGG